MANGINLKTGILPISAAAARLARLITQARTTKQPIIITQKGYPEGVLLDVATYTQLLAEAGRPAPVALAAEEVEG